MKCQHLRPKLNNPDTQGNETRKPNCSAKRRLQKTLLYKYPL